MSEQVKKDAGEIKKFFETVKEASEELGKRSGGFDKELSTKIQKVKEGAGEVVKHVEKKMDH